MVRARRIPVVGVQTGLMALGLLVEVMLTWLDAWTEWESLDTDYAERSVQEESSAAAAK